MQNVVIAGREDSFFIGPYARAFEAAGFSCTLVNTHTGFFYHSPFLRRMVRLLPLLRFIKTRAARSSNARLLERVTTLRPRLVLCIKAENISPETIAAMKRTGTITALVFVDLMDHWEFIKTMAPLYDYFFTIDMLILKRLRDELELNNAFYLPLATEPMPDPFADRTDRYPVSFIGTHNPALYPHREDYFSELKDLGLHIWGSEGWARSSLKKYFQGRSVGDQRFAIYAQSKIVVDSNWEEMPAEGLSDRPFEVMGCGALFVTDGIRADIRRLYDEGTEVIVYKDKDDLKKKVAYYLAHEGEREKIAMAGYQKTLSQHTFTARTTQILNIINEKS
ncbi:MAG: glycosyltransferase [Patescibacteria group bacterium]